MNNDKSMTTELECIDPDVGQDCWRLEEEELETNTHKLLTDHLAFCDACRLKVATTQHLAAALQDGSLDLSPTTGQVIEAPAQLFRRRSRPVVGAWGSLAFAAGLAMMVLMPPQAPDNGLERSGGEEQYFNRPIESEVILDRTAEISWTAVEGASGYRVVIEDVAGEYRHESVVETNSFTVPDDAPLPDNSLVRAYLYSIPADLGSPQGQSVNFRTGGMTDVVRHRLKAAPLVSRLLAGMGLLTVLGWAVMGRRGS